MYRFIIITVWGIALTGCHMFEDIDAIEGAAVVEDTNLSTDSNNIHGGADSDTDENVDSTTQGNTDENTGEDTEQATAESTDSISAVDTGTETNGGTDSNTNGNADIDTACEDGGRTAGEFCDLSGQPCDCENVCSEEFFGEKDDYIYYCHPKCREGDCGYLGDGFACIDKPKLGIRPVCAAIGALEPTDFSVPLYPLQITPTSASTTLNPSVPGYPEIPVLKNGFATSDDVDITLVFLGLPAKDAGTQYWRLEIVIPGTLYRPGTIGADYNGIKGFTAHLYRVRTDVGYYESIALAMEGGRLALETTPDPCTDRSNCTQRVTGSVQLDLVGLGFGFPTPKQ